MISRSQVAGAFVLAATIQGVVAGLATPEETSVKLGQLVQSGWVKICVMLTLLLLASGCVRWITPHATTVWGLRQLKSCHS